MADIIAPVIGDINFIARTVAPSTVSGFTEVISLVDAPLRVDLSRTSTPSVVPGSVNFTLTGKSYFDRNGIIFTDLLIDGSATEAGTIDYETGEISLNTWVNNTNVSITVVGCLTVYGTYTATEAWFRSAGSPLRAESAYIQVDSEAGDLITATTDSNGNIISAHARGVVNNEMGVIFIQWGDMVTAAGNETQPWYDVANVVGSQVWKPLPVFPGTIRYNSVVLSNLPLNADQLGLDPIRLPQDGRVPVFRPADVVVIHNTQDHVLPNPPVAGATYSVGRTDLSDCWLVDANGSRVATTKFVTDLSAGTVTMDAALDLTGAVLPWTAQHRIEQVNMLTDVQINGELTLSAALTRDFDEDTYVSGAMLFGDMFARATGVFDQVSWTGVWSDARIGSDATATYNPTDYPITVQNDGAITERWRLNFTSTTAFQIIGENLGVIGTGTTAADCTPVNALTGKAYFTVRAGGWGIGWANGVQLRFNTVGATAPVWATRTVLPGASLGGDHWDMQLRGDIDA